MHLSPQIGQDRLQNATLIAPNVKLSLVTSSKLPIPDVLHAQMVKLGGLVTSRVFAGARTAMLQQNLLSLLGHQRPQCQRRPLMLQLRLMHQ